MLLFRSKDEEIGSGGTPSMSTPRPDAIAAPATKSPPAGMGTPAAAPSGYNREKDPAQAAYRLTRSNFDSLTSQTTELNRQRKALVSQPGVRRSLTQPRLDSFAPPQEQFDGVPGVGDAIAEIDRRIQPLGEQRRALVPELNRHTQAFQQQIAGNEANLALQRVGAAPIPAIGSTATPNAPRPNFDNVQGGVRTTYDQQPPATPQSNQPATTAPTSSYYIGGDGVRRTINPDGTVAGADPAAVTVNRQSFGGQVGSVGSTATPALSRGPQVASTLGQSVLSMPDDNQVLLQRPHVAVRGADAMAEHYAGKEVAEAQKKLLGDLDTQRFRLEMIANNPGRRGRAAQEALEGNARQQGAVLAGQAQAAAGAVQGRADRDNALANTGLEQAGQDRRADQDSALRQQDILLRRDAQAAEQRGAKQTLTGGDGSVALLRGDGSLTPLTNPDGSNFKGPALDRGQVTPQDRLGYLRERMKGLEETIANARSLNANTDVSSFQKQLDAMNAQAESLVSGPTAAHVARLKANPEQVADFDAMFGAGAAAKYLGK